MKNFLKQNYNTTRPYYHGSTQVLYKEFSNYKFFFITTDPLYALSYSKNRECTSFSHFYEIRFKKRLNIMNLKSRKDINTMKDACIKNKKFGYLQVFNSLQSRDWSAIFDSDKERECFIDLIDKSYDGFFNYEYDTLSNRYNNVSRYNLSDEPSIGVTDIDNLIVSEIDPFTLDKVKKREQEDIEQVN
jgi:hypothetical protein